jgi:uncharacterized integral membrane protein
MTVHRTIGELSVLRRIATLLVAFPLGILIIAIAVSNRQPAQLILDPFRPEAPALTVQLPLYLFLLGALIVGVVLGGLATWFSQARWRRTARVQGQRAARYQAEADRLTRERDQNVAASKHLAIAGR